jgi:hypothetical protein
MQQQRPCQQQHSVWQQLLQCICMSGAHAHIGLHSTLVTSSCSLRRTARTLCLATDGPRRCMAKSKNGDRSKSKAAMCCTTQRLCRQSGGHGLLRHGRSHPARRNWPGGAGEGWAVGPAAGEGRYT